MTMGQLVYVLRKRISVPAEQAIFVFVGNTLPPASALVSNVVCSAAFEPVVARGRTRHAAPLRAHAARSVPYRST
jgi:hypothetical protein